jgi:hypothetical protein
MKVKKIKTPSLGTEWLFSCPACKCAHGFKIPPWSFNYDPEKPTIGGTVLVNGQSVYQNPSIDRCHSSVTDGKITYMNDSSHELKGKTVELPEIR